MFNGKIIKKQNISGMLDKPQTVYVAEMYFNNRLEFPSIGDDKKLYIATDEDSIYRFDGVDLIYKCVGRDYEEIEQIQDYLKEN